MTDGGKPDSVGKHRFEGRRVGMPREVLAMSRGLIWGCGYVV